MNLSQEKSSVERRLYFSLSNINPNILKSSTKFSISANIIRTGGDGMRRDIAEIFDRLTDLQLCSEAVVTRTRDRNEEFLNILGEVVKKMQTNMVSDIEASAEIWKRVVVTKKRWVTEYD